MKRERVKMERLKMKKSVALKRGAVNNRVCVRACMRARVCVHTHTQTYIHDSASHEKIDIRFIANMEFVCACLLPLCWYPRVHVCGRNGKLPVPRRWFIRI